MTCIILMLGGIQLFCMGILGMYLSKTYLEAKGRPIYICGETNIDHKNLAQGPTHSSIKLKEAKDVVKEIEY